MSGGGLRFAVLGPVRAWRGAAEVDLGAPQQRALLALLLVRAGEPVGLGEIVDVLWGDGSAEYRGERGAPPRLVAAEGAQSLTLDVWPAEQARDFLARRLGVGRVAAEPAAVEQIITLCAGLPLALAIVAARAAMNPAFPLGAIANELWEAHGSLEAFSGTDTGINVRATFSWSYRTLSPAAARLFRLLGTQPGPDVGVPAAASLLGVPVRQVRPLLAELTTAHMLVQSSPGRYGFHELLGAYAAELAETVDVAGELDLAKRRNVEYYRRTAFRADRLLQPQRVPPQFASLPAADDVIAEPLEDHRAALA
ncbi:hypothetical protein [Dactylosporangium sp. NPDC049140]|uniref:hypothetical protein n=1 Tax=Dactylosporangium sp. NPDC049140 TaxID=3155647 RepID=UPI003402B7D4